FTLAIVLVFVSPGNQSVIFSPGRLLATNFLLISCKPASYSIETKSTWKACNKAFCVWVSVPG
ncbi:MAG TPA: hypothetical protein VGE06_06840, partial [Flavisolibacter sp.]